MVAAEEQKKKYIYKYFSLQMSYVEEIKTRKNKKKCKIKKIRTEKSSFR